MRAMEINKNGHIELPLYEIGVAAIIHGRQTNIIPVHGGWQRFGFIASAERNAFERSLKDLLLAYPYLSSPEIEKIPLDDIIKAMLKENGRQYELKLTNEHGIIRYHLRPKGDPAMLDRNSAILTKLKILLSILKEHKIKRVTRSVTRRVDEKVVDAAETAVDAGLSIPTHPAKRYTLYLPNDFFAKGELAAHRKKYSERFNIELASGQTNEQMIRNVLGKAMGMEKRSIVLVYDTAPESELEDLVKAGIRFVRVDPAMLQRSSEFGQNAWRKTSQQDTYAIMLLVRALDPNMPEDSPVKKMLKFYLKTHFELTDAVTIDAYINALAKDDITRLIKGMLMYRPAGQYRMPEYNNVAATLISA